MRVGIVIVATGRYAQFLPPLVQSAARLFLGGHQRTFFIFTEGAPDPGWAAGTRMVHVPTAHEPWPAPTLKRYHYFCTAASSLAAMDVLYYMDADSRVVDVVGDEILPDEQHALVAVKHPGFCGSYEAPRRYARLLRKLGLSRATRRWSDVPLRGTYETRPESSAYVRPNEGRFYFMGGFNGGRAPAFLQMANTIRHNVEVDAARAITAVWHDESHLNRYLIDHPPKVLSPSYGFPESWKLPFHPRILMLDKNHGAVRAPLEAIPSGTQSAGLTRDESAARNVGADLGGQMRSRWPERPDGS